MLARDEAQLAAKKEKYPGFGDIQGTPDMVVSWLEEYAQAGSRYVTFHMPDADNIELILLLREAVLPRVARL